MGLRGIAYRSRWNLLAATMNPVLAQSLRGKWGDVRAETSRTDCSSRMKNGKSTGSLYGTTRGNLETKRAMTGTADESRASTALGQIIILRLTDVSNICQQVAAHAFEEQVWIVWCALSDLQGKAQRPTLGKPRTLNEQ